MADGRELRPRPQQEISLQVQQPMSLSFRQDLQNMFGRSFTTFNEVIAHLSTLQPQERTDAAPQLRAAILRAGNAVEDAADAFWNYVHQDANLQRGVATSSGLLDWQDLRRLADRGRNRRDKDYVFTQMKKTSEGRKERKHRQRRRKRLREQETMG
ncbi:hypothetical protein GJ744_011789 [Endocarpon pusillum]|uniref:Uncharacterized protein n=1 Tax=Endocarpon pusillum TaxID=364733 RepID=A0A8H7AJU0_9EURO|nr:hypothetical protein GJ744_011789 [Endocarpon pusillum]